MIMTKTIGTGDCIWKSTSVLDHSSWTSCGATLPLSRKTYCECNI